MPISELKSDGSEMDDVALIEDRGDDADTVDECAVDRRKIL